MIKWILVYCLSIFIKTMMLFEAVVCIVKHYISRIQNLISAEISASYQLVLGLRKQKLTKIQAQELAPNKQVIKITMVENARQLEKKPLINH